MKRDIHLIFGRNVNRLRIQRGLTQNQVLALADLDRRHYQRIERGEENPTLKVIVALGLALDALIVVSVKVRQREDLILC